MLDSHDFSHIKRETYVSEEFISELFNSIADHFDGGAIIADANSCIIKSNSWANEFLKSIELINPELNNQVLENENVKLVLAGFSKAFENKVKVKTETSFAFRGFLQKFSLCFSPIPSSGLIALFIKTINEDANEAEIYKRALDKIPADIAIFDEKLNYKFVNKSAVKDDKVRQWLIGKNDFDYCKMRNVSDKIAEERTAHLRDVEKKGFLEFIETFAGPSSAVNTWSNRKMFSFSDNSEGKFIIGYGVPIEDGKKDKDKFLDVLNSLNESVLEIDFSGKFLMYNSAWKDLVGLKSNEELNNYLVDYLHQDDKALFISNFEKVTSNTNIELDSIPVRIKARTGYLWIELKLTKKAVSRKNKSIYCIIKDIDEARKSYEIINQLRLAIEDSAEGIAVMNGSDQYTYLNKAHIQLFGYSNDYELLGKSWKVFYPPHEIERIEKEVFPEFIATGHFRGPTMGVKKDGTYLFQEISLTALPGGGLICVTHNITEELEQQKKLQQLAIVAEKTNSIVIISDKVGRIEWVNKSFEELTGYVLSEVKGLFPSEFMAGEETDLKVIEEIQYCVKNSLRFKGEILNYNKDGKKFWLYIDITPIFDQNNELQSFIAVENNITAVKNAEEKLIFALNKEKQLNSLKSHFVNLVSHEFRTPLATIQSSMDVLQVFSEKEIETNSLLLKETLAKHHYRIENEIQRMTKIMDNVLLLGRMDAGKVVFETEPLFIHNLILEIVEEFNQFGEVTRQVSFSFNGRPKQQNADPFLLRQVFVNIISNALKYSKNNIHPAVIVSYQNDKTVVEVSDHGIGIPEDELSNIFKSFYRASNAQHIQGTGLGLVIVKQLVELHGGSVQISNKQPKGTMFKVELPFDTTQ